MADEIDQAKLRFLMAYWSGLASNASIPLTSQIDPIEMRPSLGYAMLLEVVDGGRDFRYRVFGTEIAAVSEFDMTGHLLSEHRASAYIVEFALAVYRAAFVRRSAALDRALPLGRVTQRRGSDSSFHSQTLLEKSCDSSLAPCR